MCELCGYVTSYGCERLFMSSLYVYACALCAVTVAEHVQGHTEGVVLIALLGG